MRKRMKIETYDYKVAGHFLPYLINADASGLSDDELMQVEDFEKLATEEFIKDGHSCHWSTEQYGYNGGYFATCDICRLFADCYDLQLVVMVKD